MFKTVTKNYMNKVIDSSMGNSPSPTHLKFSSIEVVLTVYLPFSSPKLDYDSIFHLFKLSVKFLAICPEMN